MDKKVEKTAVKVVEKQSKSDAKITKVEKKIQKKSQKKWIAIGVAAAVAVMVAVVAAVLLMSRVSTPEVSVIEAEPYTGKSQLIEGDFTDTLVTDATAAWQALEMVKDDLGVEGVEFAKEVEETRNGALRIFGFSQVVDGVPVYGGKLAVYADDDGNAEGVIGSLKSVKKQSEKSSVEAAEVVALQSLRGDGISNAKIVEAKQYYYPYGEEAVLGYRIVAQAGARQVIMVVKDADESIIEKREVEPIEWEVKSEDIAPFKTNSPLSYVLEDAERKIVGAHFIDEVDYDDEVYYWGSVAEANRMRVDQMLDYFTKVQEIYDFYNDEYGYKGLDGKGSEMKLIMNIHMAPDGSDYSEAVAYIPTPNYIVVGEKAMPNGQVGMVAHEYTHGVFHARAEEQAAEDGARVLSVNEGYADVMGLVAQTYIENCARKGVSYADCKAHPDGVLKGSPDKDIAGSTMSYEEYAEDFSPTKLIKVPKDAHKYAYILSRAAYLMGQNLSVKQLGDLWYRALDLYKYSDGGMASMRHAVVTTARQMLREEDYLKVKEAFDGVGLKQNYNTDTVTYRLIENKRVSELLDEEADGASGGSGASGAVNTGEASSNASGSSGGSGSSGSSGSRSGGRLTKEQARQIIINNYGESWNDDDITMRYEYIARVKAGDDGKMYLVFNSYLNKSPMHAGGEWRDQISTGEYYLESIFVAEEYEGNVTECVIVDNYGRVLELKDGDTYDGVMYMTAWCKV